MNWKAKGGDFEHNSSKSLRVHQSRNCPVFSSSCFAVVASPPGPVVLRRQKKDTIPDSIFTIPPELDVSLVLEFVG